MEQQSDWGACKPMQPLEPGSEEAIKAIWATFDNGKEKT